MNAKILNKTEMKLFLTFFLTFSIFVYWSGWMEDSLFDVTRAIVDEGRLEIDTYHNNTGDRSFYNDHYYSNKAPGGAFLAVPIYFTWKSIYYNLFPSDFIKENSGSDLNSIQVVGDVGIVRYHDPGVFIMTSMTLVTIFIPSLVSALTVVIVFKSLRHFTKNEKHRMIVTLIYGFATPAFTYGRVFTTNGIGTFFAFFAFYLILKITNEKKIDHRYIFLAGIFNGFAVVSDYWTIIVAICCMIYVLSFKKIKYLALFSLGSFLGIAPLLLYNYLIFQNPLQLTFSFQDPSIWIWSNWTSASKTLGFSPDMPNLPVLFQILFYPYRGLFFYYPILLLSVLGSYHLYKAKKFKTESLVCALIFVSFVYANSVYFYWWGGYSFGTRFLLPAIPFLMFPLLYSMKVDKRILIPLIIFSIFVSFLGIQNWEEKIVDLPGEGISPAYEQQVNSFGMLENPIFDYYLPYFMKFGPRSGIFESFVGSNGRFDIRGAAISSVVGSAVSNEIKLLDTPIGFLIIKTQFLSLFTLSILVMFVWRDEFLKSRYSKAIVIFLVLWGLSFLSIMQISYSSKWHQEELYPYSTFRWMSQDATMSLFNPTELPAKLEFDIWSYNEPKTLEIFINGEFAKRYEILPVGKRIVTPLLQLNRGENKITFHSKEGCDLISEKQNNSDIRCVSFGVSNFKMLDMSSITNDGIFYDANWYFTEKYMGTEFRWMGNASSISFYNFDKKSSQLIFSAWSYYIPREMEIIVNNVSIKQIDVYTKREFNVTIPLKMEENIIEFRSMNGCDVPNVIEGTSDKRCLSAAFSDIKV